MDVLSPTGQTNDAGIVSPLRETSLFEQVNRRIMHHTEETVREFGQTV